MRRVRLRRVGAYRDTPLRAGLVLAVLVASCAGPTSAVRLEGALFEDARALAATPDGTLYVIEGATGEVLILRDGVVIDRLGGAGTTAEALIDPVALDPTNGQAVFVADRAAGTIVQFTAEGRVAGSIPVPDVDPSRPVRQSVRDGARGRPVAVAAAPDGALYVAEAGRGVVLRLDSEGTVERVLGAGVLREPVALAVADDGTLWVADAGRGELLSFDPFGALGRVVRFEPAYGRLVGVAEANGVLVLVGEHRSFIADGDDVRIVCPNGEGCASGIADPGGETSRGAAFVGRRLAVLSPSRLAFVPVGSRVVD